jgi:asparagine synthase (glutamine-hydrolysing)
LLERIAGRFGEPFADSSAIPTWLVSKLAADEVKMVLSGDGGDELFAGYNSYAAVYDAIAPRTRPDLWRRSLGWFGVGRSATASWQGIHHSQRDTFAADMRNRLMGGTAPRLEADDALTGPEGADPVSRCQYRDVGTYLLDDILTKVDRMSMDNSLEVRVPLLDHKLVEFAFGLPPDLKIGRAADGSIVTKRLLKRSAGRFYPRALVDRRKWGFGIPVHQWTNGPLKELIVDLLDHGAPRLAPHLNPAEVRKVVRDYYDGRAERIGEVWNLLGFRLWLDSTSNSGARRPIEQSSFARA